MTSVENYEQPRASDKRFTILFAALLGLSLFWTVRSVYDSTYFDAGTYIATARSLVAGEGYSYLGQPFILRPPGFSVFLSPFLAAGASPAQLNWLMSTIGLLVVLLVFVQRKDRLGKLLALTFALSLWLNPSFQRLSNQVLSDLPGVLLMLIALGIDRRSRETGSSKALWFLGAVLAVTAYVRLIYLLLIPAILFSRWSERKRAATSVPGSYRRELALLFVLPLALLLPWNLRNSFAEAPIPSEQTSNYSYSTATWKTDPGDPHSETLPLSEVAARIPIRAKQMVVGLGSHLHTIDESTPANLAFGALAIGCLLWRARTRRRAGDLCALAMFASLCIAHSSHVRLIVPIYIFAIPATLELLASFIRRRASSRNTTLVLSAGLALIVFLDLNSESVDPNLKRHRELSTLATYVESQVGPTDKLASWDGVHLSAYLDRPVLTIDFVARSEMRGGIDGAFELLIENDIDYVSIADRRGNRSPRWNAKRTRPVETEESLMLLFRKRLTLVGEAHPYLLFRVTSKD